MYYVSRQNYWPDGTLVVEVVIGGQDYANADMLVAKYPGEGEEYSNPKDAVQAAINIKELWQKDNPEAEIDLACGATGGFTLPIDSCDEEYAIEWAEKRYEKHIKCEVCHSIMGKQKFTHDLAFFDSNFCSEYCAEKDYEDCAYS